MLNSSNRKLPNHFAPDLSLPLVSIIVRTKDRPQLLENALQSIIGQSYPNIEVIVVNDGGIDIADQVQSTIGDRPFQLINHANSLGRSAAANSGLQAARGAWINFLDDDDILYANHISILVEAVQTHPFLVAYSTVRNAYFTDVSDSKPLNTEIVFNQDFNSDLLLFENYIPLMSVLFSATALSDVDGFCEELTLFEDWDFWIRLSRQHDFLHIDQITAEYRFYQDPDIQTAHRRKYAFEEAQEQIFNRVRPYLSGKTWLSFLKNGQVGRLKQDVKKLETSLANCKEIEKILKNDKQYIAKLESSLTNYKEIDKIVQNDKQYIAKLESSLTNYKEIEKILQNDKQYIAKLETSLTNYKEIEKILQNDKQYIAKLEASLTNYKEIEKILQNDKQYIAKLEAAVQNYGELSKILTNSEQYGKTLEGIIANFKALVSQKSDMINVMEIKLADATKEKYSCSQYLEKAEECQKNLTEQFQTLSAAHRHAQTKNSELEQKLEICQSELQQIQNTKWYRLGHWLSRLVKRNTNSVQ